MKGLVISSSFFLDTISNITSLQVLDISGNSLLDKVFIDEDNGTSIFGHLPNLTHLYLQDNRFTQVSKCVFHFQHCYIIYQNAKN